MEAMEVDVEQGNDAEFVTSVDGKLSFHGDGESDALVRVLQEQLLRLERPEPEIRREALAAVASHLDLTREVKTREEILQALRIQLWKEEDTLLVQNLVQVLVDVALVPLSASRRSIAGSDKKVSKERIENVSCVESGNVQARDGLVSSTSSPLKREAADARRAEKRISRLDNNFAIAKSVAQLLHEYLAAKDHVELGLASEVRLQLLHSLLKIGEKTDGIVTWESLGFVVRRHLRSSDPRVRALVLRLLVESVQERDLVVSENAAELEAENAKRRRVGDRCPAEVVQAPVVDAVHESIDLEMKPADDPQELLAKSDEHETNKLVVSGGHPEFSRSFRKVGEILLSTLSSYMKDPYPSVRETALRALMKLHSKGYELTSECCKNATNLFRDSFEYVCIAAIEMVGLWMRSHLDVKDLSSPKQCTEAFLQERVENQKSGTFSVPLLEVHTFCSTSCSSTALKAEGQGHSSCYKDSVSIECYRSDEEVCTTVTDMNMRVREAAFRVLGEAVRIPESVLLQTLTKKVAKAPKETDVSVGVPTAAQDGDTGSPNLEEGTNLLDASAAGAFVHGLEDEYLEVRCVAIEALAKLACRCERMVFGAANLLLDMLNEEVEVVRMQAMYALSQLATAGYLSVHEHQLHLFLSAVEDTSSEMRTGGRNLLTLSHLPSFSIFHSIVQALLTSLEHHPEDELGVVSTFSVLGQIHPTYTECITQELLQEIQGYLNEEVGLDEPRFAAILSLFLGAGLSNSNIVSLVPARFLSYASFISHKLPDSLPLIKLRPVGFKSVQFSWSNGEKRKLSAHIGAGCRALLISNPVGRRHNL